MHTLVRKLVLAFLSILIFLALAEIVMRVFGVGEWVPEIDADESVSRALSRGWLKEDRELLWRMKECDAACEEIRAVHPDNPCVTEASEGKKVLCLGDSCTFFARSGKPYSVLLENLLAPAHHAQVLNASVPGYTSTQGLVWLQNELLQYNPDVVTVYFGWNDHWLARAVTDGEYMEHLKLSPIRIVRLVRALTGRSVRIARGPGDRLQRVPLEEYSRNLEHIHRLVASTGAQCILITAPGVEFEATQDKLVSGGHITKNDNYIEIHERYNEVVRRLAEKGLNVIDLAASFKDVSDVQSLLTDDGIHLSDRGHTRAAEALLSFITSKTLLD